MRKNRTVLLVISAIFMITCVISPEILSRAVNLFLAISFLSAYIQSQFSTTSAQKMWILRIRNCAVAAAGIFLVARFYTLFIA